MDKKSKKKVGIFGWVIASIGTLATPIIVEIVKVENLKSDNDINNEEVNTFLDKIKIAQEEDSAKLLELEIKLDKAISEGLEKIRVSENKSNSAILHSYNVLKAIQEHLQLILAKNGIS